MRSPARAVRWLSSMRRAGRALKRWPTELQSTGVRAEAMACDVTSPSQVQDLVSRVLDTFGRVDVLINDAAYNKWIPFTDLDAMTYEEWQKILAVNLTGPMLCIKAVAPAMRRHGGGRIVNIASVAGLAPSGSSIPYAVSKAGLIHLTRCMAVGLAPDILVNCIAPGYLDGTRATANLNPEYRERARDARCSSARQTRTMSPARW